MAVPFPERKRIVYQIREIQMRIRLLRWLDCRPRDESFFIWANKSLSTELKEIQKQQHCFAWQIRKQRVPHKPASIIIFSWRWWWWWWMEGMIRRFAWFHFIEMCFALCIASDRNGTFRYQHKTGPVMFCLHEKWLFLFLSGSVPLARHSFFCSTLYFRSFIIFFSSPSSIVIIMWLWS